MPVLPGATLGILGGGQLGRMLALAARPLGYHVHVLDPDPQCAARPVVERCITADFDDVAGADALGASCDVITLEIEKIGVPALEAARRYVPVRPGASVLAVVQDRGRQKQWLTEHRYPVAPWRLVTGARELADAHAVLGDGAFVKTVHGGYDGRGQGRLRAGESHDEHWRALGGSACVVEREVSLEHEISVLVARRPGGETAVYPPALNHHDNHILTWSVLPAPISDTLAAEARRLACDLAADLGVEGLLCVEMFVSRDGELLVNELAPRPHNSYHESEAACVTSQFEQGVRAVCDLPLGSTAVVAPAAIHNLLGRSGGRAPPTSPAPSRSRA